MSRMVANLLGWGFVSRPMTYSSHRRKTARGNVVRVLSGKVVPLIMSHGRSPVLQPPAQTASRIRVRLASTAGVLLVRLVAEAEGVVAEAVRA